MEPPSKRLKLQPALYESDEDEANQDELSMTPGQFDARQDPMYQLDKGRARAATRLKSTFENIFEKYEKDFTGIGDEIDLTTGEIIINNGHLQSLEDEREDGREGSVSSDEEERILRGKASRPAKRPQPMSSLMPANPSLYNPPPPLDPYGIPPPLSFPFAPPVFGNSPTDPAWQAPELPPPLLPNGYGFGFGYNPQVPGVAQSFPFHMAPAMNTGGGHYGYHGGMAHQWGSRRLTSAKSLTRRSLPTTESKESDTDEDDILLARNEKDASPTTIAKPAPKTLTLAAFGQHTKMDSHGPRKVLTAAQSPRESDETSTGETRDHELENTPAKHQKDPSVRRVRRPKKTNATAKEQKSDKESEIPRRKLGRPKKSTRAEKSLNLQREIAKNNQPDMGTETDFHPKATTPKPTTKSTIMISLPVRQNRTSIASPQLIQDSVETTKQNSLNSQRRSSRARKQTEFYGNMKWLKLGNRPPSTSDDDINQGSESSQTDTSFSQDIMDYPGSSSPRYAESVLSERSTQPTVNNEALPESEDAWIEKEQDIQDCAELENNDNEEIDDAALSSTLLENENTRDKNNDLVLAQSPPILGPSELERGGTIATEVPLQTTEVFSRNELDPSYNFSDDDDEELVRKPVDLADDARPAPREQHTSGGGTRVFGNKDASPDRQIGSDDITTNRMSAISDPSEPAKPESVLETDSRDGFRVSDIPCIPDREVSQHQIESPSNTRSTPEADLPPQESGLQQGLREPSSRPTTPGRTATNQTRSPTLSPELHIRSPPRESEIISRLSPELGENNAGLEASADEESAAEDSGVELAGSSKSPEARPAAVSRTRVSAPVTPQKPNRAETGQNDPTSSSAKRFALASLVPDADDDGGEEENNSDELSIISSNHYTPRSFRAKLARARRRSLASPYSYVPSVSTPSRARHHHHGLLVRTPATDSRALVRASRNALGGNKDRLARDSNVLSSPLARAAAENLLLRTPRHKRKRPTSPTESLVTTPGGTTRRCGEDGFVCERDFCFTCCK
ncbi:hypothetical protein F4810DRAFT_595674 [Camillea tinctor]|nr:hypothetical protein F4810DRAFT_595674 [Camillea tinctor]